ncbi:hypothetical protein PND81_17240 [Flavonifractor plautii]|uniref:hypothetical protein n=1 Tax=Flavonifractor plautii TaxID=292800 RepID=UPI0018993364|nr:hypothetical protein [Flavonifractor plautii]MDB7903060.1 hypothetical protein [Flavonifractor plautii]
MARAIDGELLELEIANIANKLAKSDAQKALMGRVMYCVEHMPTLTPPNEWVNRVRELDELYTKLQIVTGFTAEQLLEIFAAGYTLEKPDYSKKFAEMENLAEAAQPNEPLTLEELREMDGEPVYIIAKDMGIAEWNVITGKEPIAIAYDCPMPGFKSVVEGIAFANGRAFRAGAYGITWLAYRRPPEGEANA